MFLGPKIRASRRQSSQCGHRIGNPHPVGNPFGYQTRSLITIINPMMTIGCLVHYTPQIPTARRAPLLADSWAHKSRNDKSRHSAIKGPPPLVDRRQISREADGQCFANVGSKRVPRICPRLIVLTINIMGHPQKTTRSHTITSFSNHRQNTNKHDPVHGGY